MIINFFVEGASGDTKATKELIERNITEMEIPSGVETIGSYTFAGCSGLTNVTVPASVSNIKIYAFENCQGLSNIKFEGSTAPSVDDNAFSMLPKDVEVETPEGADYDTVKEKIEEGKAHKVIVTTASGQEVKYINSSKLSNQNFSGDYINVETSDGVTEIDDNAFVNTSMSKFIAGEDAKTSKCSPFWSTSLTEVEYKASEFDYFDCRLFSSAFGGTNVNKISFPNIDVAPDLYLSMMAQEGQAWASTGTLNVKQGSTGWDAWIEQLGTGWTINYIGASSDDTDDDTDGGLSAVPDDYTVQAGDTLYVEINSDYMQTFSGEDYVVSFDNDSQEANITYNDTDYFYSYDGSLTKYDADVDGSVEASFDDLPFTLDNSTTGYIKVTFTDAPEYVNVEEGGWYM